METVIKIKKQCWIGWQRALSVVRHVVSPSSTLLFFLPFIVCSCGFQSYQAKPLDPITSARQLRTHDPDSEAFHQFLISQGYNSGTFPIQQWGANELVLVALFFHPSLDVARAQWRAAQAGEISAGQRLNPGISGNAENHSDTQGGISPWTYGLGIDIPIETAGKRQARLDRASNLSDAARLDIATIAWQVREKLLTSLTDYQASQQQAQILQEEVDLRMRIVAMMQARYDTGLISTPELGSARLQLQKAQQMQASEQGRLPQLRAALAASAGLTPATLSRMSLAGPDISTLVSQQQSWFEQNAGLELQQAALLNRLDIRAALARYAAAEAKLRLEIARQYPDLVLSPGYSFDQGDRIWSFSLATVISLLNKNQGLIAEARALREVEGAQFLALQASVIDQSGQAAARYQASLLELDKARELEVAQQKRQQQLERQFAAGYADRLETDTAQLENLLARQYTASVTFQALRAAQALENSLQHPLEDSPLPFTGIENMSSP